MSGFGRRLADAVSRAGRCARASTRIPNCCGPGGCPSTPTGCARFCDICVEAFAGFAVVKPQVAFFEAYGAAGYAVLERTIGALRAAGVLVLADAKRGDIGSTMAAYAEAWAGDSPLAADAVTASPYLGFGSLQPLLDTATAHGRGVFVLAATSNPEGASVQRADAGGRTVAQSIVDAAAAVNRESSPEPGSVGVVVGATCPTRPTSARWAVRSWCRASARRADGPRRSAALAGRTPGPAAARGVARGAAGRTGRGRTAGRGGAVPRRGRVPGAERSSTPRRAHDNRRRPRRRPTASAASRIRPVMSPRSRVR